MDGGAVAVNVPLPVLDYLGQPSSFTLSSTALLLPCADAGRTPPEGTNHTSTRRFFASSSVSWTRLPWISPVDDSQKYGWKSIPLSAAPAAVIAMLAAEKPRQICAPALITAAAFR